MLPGENESPIKELHLWGDAEKAAVAQLVEHLVVTQVVPGSSPGGGAFPDSVRVEETRSRLQPGTLKRWPRLRIGERALSSVWLERSAHNRVVVGSNPTGPICRERREHQEDPDRRSVRPRGPRAEVTPFAVTSGISRSITVRDTSLRNLSRIVGFDEGERVAWERMTPGKATEPTKSIR